MKRLFREDPEALADLRALETGAIAEEEFERRFGARLGLDDSSQLIDSLFAGHGPGRGDDRRGALGARRGRSRPG